MKLIGRKQEIEILMKALASKRPEMIALYGRRRVGKTFLIRNVYEKKIAFELVGLHRGSLKEQLENFEQVLSKKKSSFPTPASWLEAFDQLERHLALLSSSTKKVIFFDEFPWLDSRKSGFLTAFTSFWNRFASKRSDVIVVICGSAASYMIQNIIKNKGGLHNRLTAKIRLMPFSLYETELLLKHNGVVFTRYDILQIYMAMGGIPQYLEMINSGESVAQAIDRLCFSKNGFLRTEFDNVFASLFDQHQNHEAIIRILASVRKGMTRNDLSSKSRLPAGGGFTKTLLELEESGFIERYSPYDRKVKDSIYRLTDEYSLFYIKFIEPVKPSNGNVWLKMYSKQTYKSWSGFCFETLCIKHIRQIKEGLKISGIHSVESSWIDKKAAKGAQIDLVIDRDDNVINLCEMKFYDSPFTIEKAYAEELENKKKVFSSSTKTKKTLFLTFITTHGLVPNKYSHELVQNQLTIDQLFMDL